MGRGNQKGVKKHKRGKHWVMVLNHLRLKEKWSQLRSNYSL